MRRKDREITDFDEMMKIIAKCDTCRLALEICSAMTKKETSATAPITVTKVSSEHMTSGISAVLTLPCSAPIRWSALYSLLSNSIKPEYAKPVKKCAGFLAES